MTANLNVKQKLLLFVYLFFTSQIFGQGLDIGLRTGIGVHTYETTEGRAYLKNFPSTPYNTFTYGVQARYTLENNLLFSYQIRYFSQEVSATEVILPPFVYEDLWANIDINFTRIQNFFGLGYMLKSGKISFVPQVDVMFSFANNFDVGLEFNENAVNQPVGEVSDPDLSPDRNEYGIRASLGTEWKCNDRLTLALNSGYIYGEMELVVQDAATYSGGDNITTGFELELAVFYNISN